MSHRNTRSELHQFGHLSDEAEGKTHIQMKLGTAKILTIQLVIGHRTTDGVYISSTSNYHTLGG